MLMLQSSLFCGNIKNLTLLHAMVHAVTGYFISFFWRVKRSWIIAGFPGDNFLLCLKHPPLKFQSALFSGKIYKFPPKLPQISAF